MFRRTISLLLVVTLFFGSSSFSYAEENDPGVSLRETPDPCDPQGSMSFRGWSMTEKKCLAGQAKRHEMQAAPLLEGENLLQQFNYQVHILGEVASPGTYRLLPSTRLSEAVARAGGILERGSERRIQWRRKDQKTRQVDLFSFRNQANLDENPFLNDNDVIFVPLRERVVQVAGTVKRPGIYELKHEKTLQDIVALAGGLTPGAGNPTPINVVRFVDGKKEKMEIPNVEEERRKFQVQSSDVIIVPHFLTKGKQFDYNVGVLPGDSGLFFPSYEERVFVIGAVRKPGPFLFSPYYSLGQYLTLAGGTVTQAKRASKWRIIDSQGKSRKGKINSEINPGDTIVVPEKYISPETLLTIFLASAATILGSISTVVALTR